MKPTLQCGASSVARARSLRRRYLNRPAAGQRINYPEAVGYGVDLDPQHRVLRITVSTALTDGVAREIYRTVARLASRGGPYAAITDFSQVVDFPISADTIRDLAATAPPNTAGGRRSVMVAQQPALFGLARMFELHRDSIGVEVQVVHSMDEAYDLLNVSPEDFSQRLFPVDVAARSRHATVRSRRGA
jgi:hypothetical protein